jgi:parallel beta-helix repeat protein
MTNRSSIGRIFLLSNSGNFGYMERIKIEDPIENRHDETIEELSNKMIEGHIKIRNCVNCTIVNCDITSDDSEHMFVLWNCRGCKVINSKFHDKSSDGCAVKVDGDFKAKEDGDGVDEKTISDGNLFEGCTWENLSGNCEEPLRIGDSARSHLFYNTTVRNCTFRNLKAGEETISIKSCGNTIDNCEHGDCESSITIRYGPTNTIQDCTFTGKDGGIRLYGKDNKILRNTFKENKSDKHYPLRLHKAEEDKERNDGSPVSSQSTHHDHTQVINNEISVNTFENCRICVRWGKDSGKKPTRVQFKNNKVIADKERSVVIDFGDDEEPFVDDNGEPLHNELADNEVIGTEAIIDIRVESGFKKPITSKG